MINLNSNLASLGSFDSFAATSKACIGMVWTLLRVNEVDSTLSATWPYLCIIEMKCHVTATFWLKYRGK